MKVATVESVIAAAAGGVETAMEKALTNGYGRSALSKVFDLVKSESHWKDPINAVVKGVPASMIEAVIEVVTTAIEFFTATVPSVRVVGTSLKMDPKVIVFEIAFEAVGYRNGPAA